MTRKRSESKRIRSAISSIAQPPRQPAKTLTARIYSGQGRQLEPRKPIQRQTKNPGFPPRKSRICHLSAAAMDANSVCWRSRSSVRTKETYSAPNGCDPRTESAGIVLVSESTIVPSLSTSTGRNAGFRAALLSVFQRGGARHRARAANHDLFSVRAWKTASDASTQKEAPDGLNIWPSGAGFNVCAARNAAKEVSRHHGGESSVT